MASKITQSEGEPGHFEFEASMRPSVGGSQEPPINAIGKSVVKTHPNLSGNQQMLTRNVTTLTLTKSMINTIKGSLVKQSNSIGSLGRGSTLTST